MEDLYEKGILHQDISDNNVMITLDGRGRLIDFDLAREVNYSGSGRTTRAVRLFLRSADRGSLTTNLGYMAVHVHRATPHPRKGPHTMR